MFQFSFCLVHAVWLIRASCLRIHTSLLRRHLAVLPSSFMPFCSYLIAHTSLLLPHCHHSSYFIADVSFLTLPRSCLLVHTVALMPRFSYLVAHAIVLISGCSYLIAHSSLSMVHLSFCLVHAGWLIPRASCLLAHTSLLIRRLAVLPSLLMPFCSYRLAHTFATYASLLIPCSSYFIGDVSFPTPPCSCLLVHTVVLMPRSSYLVAHAIVLIVHCSYLIAHTSLLIPLCSYLIAHT